MASDRAERYVALGKQLGHDQWKVRPTRSGFRGDCSCGFETVTQRTEVQVAEVMYGHLRKVVDAHLAEVRQSGVSHPGLKAAAL